MRLIILFLCSCLVIANADPVTVDWLRKLIAEDHISNYSKLKMPKNMTQYKNKLIQAYWDGHKIGHHAGYQQAIDRVQSIIDSSFNDVGMKVCWGNEDSLRWTLSYDAHDNVAVQYWIEYAARLERIIKLYRIQDDYNARNSTQALQNIATELRQMNYDRRQERYDAEIEKINERIRKMFE